MLKSEDIKTRMSQVISAKIEMLTDEAVLQHLVSDSFILIDMVIDLQSTFNVRLDQEDLVNVQTVGDLIKVIQSK
ncbi:MAG: phosphopantetheine-binding protein [Bdellovibrio sp.]